MTEDRRERKRGTKEGDRSSAVSYNSVAGFFLGSFTIALLWGLKSTKSRKEAGVNRHTKAGVPPLHNIMQVSH